MTPNEYRDARKERGTLKQVALQLGIDWTTLQRRETGRMRITREAQFAILALRRKDAVTGVLKRELFDALVKARGKLFRIDPGFCSHLNGLAILLNQCPEQTLTPTPLTVLIPEPKPLRKFGRKLHLR